jgi:hypothetical protein
MLAPLAFPCVPNSTGRWMQDANGRPITLLGDTCWGAPNELTLEEWRLYLADRRAKGFNLLKLQASNPDVNGDNVESVAPAAVGAGGAKPYLLNVSGGTWTGVLANHDAAFDSPNDTYWNWIDTMMTEARLYGFLVIIDPLYWGQTGGWWANLQQAHNTQTVHYNHGLYLGDRWKNHPNLIVSHGTDRFPTSGSEDSARFGELMRGIVDAGFVGSGITAHYKRSSDSLDYSDYSSRVTFNSVYPGTGAGNTYTAVYGRIRTAYAKSPPMPMANVEAIYDGDPAGGGAPTRAQLRSYGYQSFTNRCGYIFGQRRVEAFEKVSGVPIWQDYLSTDTTLDAQRMGEFFSAIPSHMLVPDGLDGIGTLVTAGLGGSQTVSSVGVNGVTAGPDGSGGTDRVTAAATADGTYMVAYVPHPHSGSVTFDMTKMSGSSVRVRLFDPSNGVYKLVGRFANSGTQAFTVGVNASGSNDWMILFDLGTDAQPRAHSPALSGGSRSSSRLM